MELAPTLPAEGDIPIITCGRIEIRKPIKRVGYHLPTRYYQATIIYIKEQKEWAFLLRFFIL